MLVSFASRRDMPNPSRRSRSAVDRDGVRVAPDDGGPRRRALLALAVVALAAAVALVLQARPPAPASPDVASAPAPRVAEPAPPPVAAAAAGVPPERATAAGTRPRVVPRRMSDEALLAALQRAEARGTIDVGAPGDTGGIAAFPPPGTKPVKRGIVVPDDFELPPGYVRHFQTLDDGRQLPAVLMFHPDFELVDASGRIVPLPADRLVPPELAPEGLAIDILDVPEPEIEVVEPRGAGPRVALPSR
jgi:hypothetical protein